MLYLRRHPIFILVEVLLLLLALGLDVLVALHPGPLPGDVGSMLTVQHLLLPHKTLTLLINQTSELTWPLPATLTTIAVVGLFLALRRWLDALLLAVIPGVGSASSYLTTLLVQRPRPLGHGLYIQMMVKGFYSFPSGHVEHALVFFGLLVFLTYQVRRPGWWAWPLRLVLLAVIVVIGPSRMLEGEHWLSDVVAGYLYGAFWLVLGIQVYGWAARRWPRLLGSGEHKSAAA
jgi:undecaprenyl-diphosphatase